MALQIVRLRHIRRTTQRMLRVLVNLVEIRNIVGQIRTSVDLAHIIGECTIIF